METLVHTLQADYFYSQHDPTSIASWGILWLCIFSFLFFLTLLISRVRKTKTDKYKLKARADLEERLTEYTMDEDQFQFHTAAYKELVTHLMGYAKNRMARKILVDILLELHAQFKGIAEGRIQTLYNDLHIKQDALRILRHGEWYEKAFIIKELSLMNVKEALPHIQRYVNHHNVTLREEAQFASINLGGLGNLHFLSSIKTPVSEWQQTRILLQLEHYYQNQIPSFYYLLRSRNPSVVKFALKLISYFRQKGDVQEIFMLFKQHGTDVRSLAIECLIILDEFEALDFLMQTYPRQPRVVKLNILNAIGKLGDENQWIVLEQSLMSDDYDECMAAARAIVRLHTESNIKLDFLNPQQRAIMAHAHYEAVA